MKRLALIIVLALLGSLPVWATRCQFQAAGTAASGTGAVSPSWPAPQTNDVALLFVESANEIISLSTSAGFAEIANSPQGTGTAASTTATRLAVFWNRATSSAMGAPTVADPGDHVYAIILTFRGCVSSGNPWDITAGGVKASASTTSTFGAVTTTVDSDLIVLAASRENDSTSAAWSAWTNANLANITERSDGGTTSGNGGGIGIATADQAAAGSTGSSTATVTSTIDGHMTIALKSDPLTACSGTCPTHVQTRVWGTNDGGQTLSSMKYTLQNPVLANNGVLCGLSYDTTSVTSTITDNIGANTWTQEASCNDGTRVHKIYYSKNTAAGTQTLTVTLSASEYNVHFACSEFYNVGDVDGTPSCTAGTTGPAIPAGSITTTQDNDLVYSYAIDEAGLCCTTAVTAWVPDPSFNLLPPSRHLGHASQWFAWGSHGAINPTLTANQSSHDTFGAAAVALKAVSSGTVPTIVPRIVYLISESLNAAAYTVQFPCPGCNLIVTRTAESTTQNGITSVTDTDGNTYSKVSAASNYPQMYYAANATVTNSNSRTMTFNNANTGVTAIAMISGIAGADPSPLGAVATATPPDQTHIGGAGCPGASGSDMDHTPDITTTRANSLVMAVVNNGTGPECALVGTGYVFDSTWYPGQDDSSTGFLESSSGYGHINAAAVAAYDFHWNLANATISGSSPMAAEFKSPAAAASGRKRVIVTSE